MSTIGAIFINAENIINNLLFNTGKKGDKKDNDKGTEMLELKDEEEKNNK